MSANSSQTVNADGPQSPANKKRGKSVSVGFRLPIADYDDAYATFKSVTGHDGSGDTEVFTSVTQFYRLHARTGKQVSNVENPLTSEVEKLQTQLTTANQSLQAANEQLQTVSEELSTLKTIHQDLITANTEVTEKLSKNFLIEENEETRAFVEWQQRRAKAGKESSETLTTFIGFIYRLLKKFLKNPKEELLT